MDEGKPEVFTAAKQEGTGPALLAIIIGVSIICVFIVAYLGSVGLDRGGEIISPYFSYLVAVPLMAVIDWVVYRRLKSLAPSGKDKVEIYGDRLEIYKAEGVRKIGFKEIMSLTAVTNSYGIIFLQVDLAEGMVKIVGMNDLQGLFESIAKHLSPYIVKKENFLRGMISRQ